MVNFSKVVVFVTTLLPAISALPIASNEFEGSSTEKYIITFKRGLAEDEMASHLDFANDLHARSLARRGLTKRHEEGIRRRFAIHDHRSYSAVFDAETLSAISSHSAVEAVEPNYEVSVDDHPAEIPHDEFSMDEKSDIPHDEFSMDAGQKIKARLSSSINTQKDAPWGLSSISLNHYAGRADVIKKFLYYSDSQGEGIYAYVVDSGVRISHKEFEGRASYGANFVANETDVDHKGHGTHVAGTIGAKTYGVAKKVKIISVKVLHAGGKTDSETLLSGYEWVLSNAKKQNRVSKSVVNISVGGPTAKYYSDAMENLHNAGLAVFVSAGNDAIDASNKSPASTPSIFTVASITNVNKISSFSNFGKVVDIFAPGSDIISLSSTSDTGTLKMSGTSMASPHAAGVAAGLKSRYGSAMDKPTAVYSKMIDLSVKDIMGDTKGCPNRILANEFGKAKEVPHPDYDHNKRPPM